MGKASTGGEGRGSFVRSVLVRAGDPDQSALTATDELAIDGTKPSQEEPFVSLACRMLIALRFPIHPINVQTSRFVLFERISRIVMDFA